MHSSGLRIAGAICSRFIELLDEEGDDLTPYLEQPSKLFTIGELTKVLERRFNMEVCIEVIDSHSDILMTTIE